MFPSQIWATKPTQCPLIAITTKLKHDKTKFLYRIVMLLCLFFCWTATFPSGNTHCWIDLFYCNKLCRRVMSNAMVFSQLNSTFLRVQLLKPGSCRKLILPWIFLPFNWIIMILFWDVLKRSPHIYLKWPYSRWSCYATLCIHDHFHLSWRTTDNYRTVDSKQLFTEDELLLQWRCYFILITTICKCWTSIVNIRKLDL